MSDDATIKKVIVGAAIVIGIIVLVKCMRKKEKFVPSAYFQSANLLPQHRAPLSVMYGNNAVNNNQIEDANLMKTVI